jgi:hypothetical protein
LEAGLEEVRASPRDHGSLKLIVARPAENERTVLESATLDTTEGLIGDYWQGDDPRTQLTVMNARVAALVARRPERRPLAGDQLYVDLDLGVENLPPGTRLALGDAVIAVSDIPHIGCGKFLKRFGVDAQKFVNSVAGRELGLRGINARVIVGGTVRVGDSVTKQR